MQMKNIQIRDRTRHVHQIEDKVVLDFELDSKSVSAILNWIGSPPWHLHLLGSNSLLMSQMSSMIHSLISQEWKKKGMRKDGDMSSACDMEEEAEECQL
jgi:hypothetical protein